MLVGKKFPDMWQNERRIKCRLEWENSRLKGEPKAFSGLQPILIASRQRKFLIIVALGDGLGCYRVDTRVGVLYKGIGQFRSRGSWQQLLWGLVSSRDFYPMNLVLGSTPVALV